MMNAMIPTQKERIFFSIILGTAAVLCVAIFWPFLTVIIVGAVLAVVLRPLFMKINAGLRGRVPWVAALATVILFLITLGVPLFFIGMKVFSEAQSLYVSLAESGGASHYVDIISAPLHAAFPDVPALDIKNRVDDIASLLLRSTADIFATTITTAFSILLIVLSLFYFLKDGDKWKRFIMDISPLSDEHDIRILTMLGRAVNGIMTGYVLVALTQGFLMGIGLWVFGVPNPSLWGVIAAIASMIPSIGTALVSVPAVLYLLGTGDTVTAIGLAAWSVGLVATVDNFLNPIVVGKKINLPPLVVLFSVLGGIALMGAPGIVIGPLAVSLLYTLTTIYKEDFGGATRA